MPTASEALRLARHDLGKYVAFQIRWLDADAPDADLREALIADLRSTRRGPDGSEDASQVWARLRPSLEESGVELGELDASMAIIAALLPALDTAPRTELNAGRAAALAVGETLKQLARAAKES